MPQVQLGLSSHKRRTTWNPVTRVVNYLVEQTETNPYDGIDHIQRPGLAGFATLGALPIQGVFRQAGTLNGDFLAASGAELFRLTEAGVPTYIGNFDDLGRFIAAATATRVLFTVDGKGYRTDGVVLDDLIIPDSRPVSSVAQINGYFILTQSESARFYWIEPGQTDPDGLSFATTESTPGDNVKVERVGDELWFIKEEGTEVWVPTGDADLPFQRVPGRNYDKGSRAQDTICRFDNSVAWVGNDGVVYRGDATPIRFSDHTVEEQIRKSEVTDLRAWSFSVDGHTVYCLSHSFGTEVYDASSQQWSEFKSYGLPYWRAYVGDAGDTFTVAGDSETGRLYRLDPQISNDFGEPLERILTGSIPVVGNMVRCNSLDVYASTGTASDPNLFPKVRVSWSDDGETYGDWEDLSLGRQGQYRVPVRMNRLGAMSFPGRIFRFQVTDDVVATIHAAAVNEPSRVR